MASPQVIEPEVRNYECDIEGIVNNAVYLNYLEHARYEYIRSLGTDFLSLHNYGTDPVVARIEIDYRKPLVAGDRVRVDEVFFEWYKIAATPHTFSYVSKAFVNAEGDGKLGVINKDRTPVKAASINGPGESYRRQLDLMKDDTVKIVGEEGSFYQIVPFTDSYVFLPPQSVRPATKTELGRHAPSRRAETEFPVESIIDAPKPDPPSELVAEVLPVAQVIDTTQQPPQPQEGPTPTSVVRRVPRDIGSKRPPILITEGVRIVSVASHTTTTVATTTCSENSFSECRNIDGEPPISSTTIVANP